MRIFFIHGFGEKPDIFNNIAPAIGGEQVFIDLWKELENEDSEGLNVADFSKKLIAVYNISSHDWVIGHSMGGWIAYYMKQHCNCTIIQVSSFTDFKKVITPVRSRKLAYWLAGKGIFFNPLMKRLLTIPYHKLPSRKVNDDNFDRLIASGKEAVIKQLKLIFEPVSAGTTTPDLRIHAVKDMIVRPPAEAFHEVPGDHYSLVTNPEAVLQPILALQKKQ